MNLTDLANARSGFSQEMNNLLTLIAGNHTAEQRTTQINTTTAECFQLCKTAKAVRVANPNSIDTAEFYSRPGLPLCELMDGFHTNLGGTRMYELFCTPVNTQYAGVTCNQTQAPIIPGPLTFIYAAGTDMDVGMQGFQGTITVNDGAETWTYAEPTDIKVKTLPDSGDGTCKLELVGDLKRMDAHYQIAKKDIIDVTLWGTECRVQYWDEFLHGCSREDFRITAPDSPKFGGDFGTSLSLFFHACTHFNSDISHWDVCAVTSFNSIFQLCYNFNQPLQSWDMSSALDTRHMFWEARSFNQPIQDWVMPNNTNMVGMFYNAQAFNQPLERLDVDNVQLFSEMFENAVSFNQDISGWDTSSATNMKEMFRNASTFNQDLSGWDVSGVGSTYYTDFSTGSALTTENMPLF